VNAIARLEAWCATLVEQSFARAFPGALDPAHLGRKLVATIERAPPRPAGSRASRYTVRVGPADFARLEAERPLLERQWTKMASALCARAGLSLPFPPAVVLSADPALRAGTSAIDVDHPDPQAPVPALRVERGLSGAAVFRLPPPPAPASAIVGRDSACDVVLADPRVSRRHVRILIDPDGTLAFEDLGSSNGTLHNGAARSRGPLRVGDRLRVGDTTLVVETAQ
jgi:hypothetical protein